MIPPERAGSRNGFPELKGDSLLKPLEEGKPMLAPLYIFGYASSSSSEKTFALVVEFPPSFPQDWTLRPLYEVLAAAAAPSQPRRQDHPQTNAQIS